MKTYSFLTLLLLLGLSSYVCAQVRISGVVTSSEDGLPIPGVCIMVKEGKGGTLTDAEGAYSLLLPDTTVNKVLIFSFVGFKTVEKEINGALVVNCALDPETAELEPIAIIGYAVQKGHLQGKTAGVRTRQYNPSHERPLRDESYNVIHENGFKNVSVNPLSTFSIDVDRASYSNIRRFINKGELPPADAVRIEEMVNYFNYNYPLPDDEHPVAVYSEVSECPWQAEHKLIHIGLQAKKIDADSLPPCNVVFLTDVSGSMESADKLPLLKTALRMLVANLREQDKVAIVAYAGAAGLVLESTSGANKEAILDAIDRLQAGGSTAGGAGINLAYKVAQENFIAKGNNRVILATDGDFNVGSSSDADMEHLIESKRESGIFLTCLGFGMGNYKDSKLETLADKGNGNYAYIDTEEEAQKTLVEEFGGTMFCVAKDVKVQVEFNPEAVQAYRLVGYENRLLEDEDFNNDTKDAGDMGAGHSVTVLYEIIPVGVNSKFTPSTDPLKYQKSKTIRPIQNADEVANVKIRYKEPEQKESRLLEFPVVFSDQSIGKTSDTYRFSAAVALFGMLLRESEYVKNCNYESVLSLAREAVNNDPNGYRKEFLALVNTLESEEKNHE